MNPVAIPVNFLLLVACPVLLAASSPLSPDQAKILESVRASALQYTQKLPDFMCIQITRRQVSSLPSFPTSASGASGPRSVFASQPGAMPSSDLNDVIDERLTFIDHKENYTVLAVDGRKVAGKDHLQFPGTISAGEFGTDLHDIFDPRSGTAFAWNRPGTLHGRRVDILSFRVPAQRGATVIDRDSGRQIVAPYAGRVLVDAASFDVLRIAYEIALPSGFPIRDATVTIEYKPIAIAARSYMLPFRSQLRVQDQYRQYVNTIDFRSYHKFTVESTILYDDHPPQ